MKPVETKASDRSIGPYLLAAFGLFLLWSNSFIAVSYLLGRDGAAARFDWVGLTVARFLTAGLLCATYCFAFRRAESTSILRAEWPRLLVCGFFAVPGYNLALYYGQQHGVRIARCIVAMPDQVGERPRQQVRVERVAETRHGVARMDIGEVDVVRSQPAQLREHFRGAARALQRQAVLQEGVV